MARLRSASVRRSVRRSVPAVVPWANGTLALALALAIAPSFVQPGVARAQEPAEPSSPDPVRHDTAQPSMGEAGEGIVTLRHWKIEKGRFPEFLEASRTGVWPFFEKIGARVVGMWKVEHPVIDGERRGEESPDHDEVYLMTRYASWTHWRATRDMVELGGNGPDWEKCMEALRFRRSVTIETSLTFLEGLTWQNPPWFLPALDEEYRKIE